MVPRRVRGMAAFWVIWGGLIASFTGSGLTRFGLSVWMYQETRDAQAFALLLFFGVLPLSIGALIAGPLVDRLDRRRVLVVSNAVTRVPTLFVMVLWWQGGLELWHIYLALAVNGLANAFVLPAFDASVRMLVPREHLGRASGYSQIMQSLGVVVGPPIAGLFLVAFGLGSIFVIDLVTVVLALVALAFVRIPHPVRSLTAGATSVWGDFVFGLRYVVERPAFLFLSLFLALVVFGWGFVYALSGPIVLGLGNEATIGIMYAVFGIGSVVGAVAFAAWGGPRRRIPAILVATLASGVLTVLAGLRPNVLWIGFFIALLGSAQAVMLALHRLVFQVHGAPEVLGRVFAFRMVLTAAAQALGIVVAGSLAANVFEPAMAAGGAWAARLGPWIGSGEGRGAALLQVVVGLLVVGLALASAASPRVRRLEEGLEAVAAPGRGGGRIVPVPLPVVGMPPDGDRHAAGASRTPGRRSAGRAR
jgi:MFS transporter, DHA3 family, macrolide efflux protein